MKFLGKKSLYPLALAILSILLTSASSLSLMRLYSHDTVHHYLSHLWFLQVLKSDHFPFWYSAPLASFPTSTLQLGQWFHSPYIYFLPLFNISYDYFDLRFEFLFWRIVSFLGFYLFSGHHLSSSIARVTAASLYIASGMVASTDPEILFLQAFAFIPWILLSLNMFFDYPVRAAALFSLTVSFLTWFGYHGVGLVLPVFCAPPLLFFLSTSNNFKSFSKRVFLLAISGITIIIMVSLKISDTLTVPLFGDQLGPSRSSFEGLLLPSQLLSLSLPNPTFFYSPEEPVSLQSLYIGIIPFLIFLFLLDFCIEIIAIKTKVKLNNNLLFINNIYIVNSFFLFLGYFEASFSTLFFYILTCRFVRHFAASDFRNRSRLQFEPPTDVLSYQLLRSFFISFTLPQRSLACQIVIALLTGIATPIVGFLQSLYPPMQMVRYQSNNLIFLVVGCIIFSLFLLEYFVNNSRILERVFKFRERFLFVFQFVLIIALWLLLHISNYYDEYYNERSIMFLSIFSYFLMCLLGLFFVVLVTFFLIKNIFDRYSHILIYFVLLLLFSLVIYFSETMLFMSPVFFSSIRDPGYISFIINWIHFFVMFSAIVLLFSHVRFSKNSLSVWCLLCVLDVSIASNLYVFQSTIILGSPNNVSSFWSDISTPKFRVGPEHISISYHPQSLTPGMWTFTDIMPSSITFMKSHTSVMRNLVINLPQYCGSINDERFHYIYSVIDVYFSEHCLILFNNNTNTAVKPIVEKWVGSRIVVSVFASEPSYLVFLDGWAPGWNATIDGHETPVLRGNRAVRAIRIPAGYSRVESEYFPVGFWLIFPLTIICFILCIIIILLTTGINGGPVIVSARLWFGSGSLPVTPYDASKSY